jgi:cobalt-zinc-cadmium resistance protein CzcA
VAIQRRLRRGQPFGTAAWSKAGEIIRVAKWLERSRRSDEAMRLKLTRQIALLVLLVILFSNLCAGRAAAGKNAVVDVTVACPGLSTEEVERQVAIPIEVLMAGTPALEHTRSLSLPELAWVRLEFQVRADPDQPRQQAIRRLASAPPFPAGAVPQVSPAPLADQLLRYTLRAPKDRQGRDLYASSDLRAMQGRLEQQLRLVPGVAGVLTSGGTLKRYEIQIDPNRLGRYGIGLAQVQTALASTRTSAGGGSVNQGKVATMDPIDKVLGLKDPREAAGKLRAEEEQRVRELRSLVIASVNNVPVHIEDLVDGGRLASPLFQAPYRAVWEFGR